MDIAFLPKGIALGFAVAAPVGPIGVLVIRRTLAHGRLYGLVTGLGTATADTLYASIAGFGLTSLAALLTGLSGWTRLLGGLFLCYLGLVTMLSKPANEAAKAGGAGLTGAYLSALLLTITNPTTILSFVALFAGLGVGSSGGDFATASLLVLGVFLGSATWWFILSGATSLLRARFDAHWLLWVNRVSGAIILAGGLVALWSLL